MNINTQQPCEPSRARYAQTTTAIAVHLASENPIFGESVIEVALDDYAAGPFIVLRQSESVGEIKMDYDQLLMIVDAAKMLMDGTLSGEGKC